MEVSSIEQSNNNKGTAESSETVILIIVLFVFLLIGLAQASRLTNLSFWQDQVMFVDPAANLYFGNGFTSSTWFSQTKDEFWAGYPPLYSLLLYLWMQLFGFGIYTAPSLNCVLTVACAVILWQSLIRLSIVTSARNRLILITILLLQLAYMSNSEKGRPDILMACLAIACLLVYSIQFAWLRYIFLTCLCSLFPLAGLALLAYTIVLCSLLLIYLRKPFLRNFVFIISGLLIGSLIIYILYSTNGVWDGFIASIINNPTLAGFSQRDKIGGIFGNRILQILVITCLCLVAFKLAKRRFSWFSKLSFGLILIFWIPIGMRLAGAFQASYSWMLVIPLAICISSSLDEFFRISLDRWVKLPILGSFLVLCLVVSPYTNFVSLVLNWKSSDFSPVESFVQVNIKRDEWIFSDSIAYFSAKKGGRIVIWKPYLNTIPLEQIKKISVLIARPKDVSLLQDTLGGNWNKHSETLTISYGEQVAELGIYRRGQ